MDKAHLSKFFRGFTLNRKSIVAKIVFWYDRIKSFFRYQFTGLIMILSVTTVFRITVLSLVVSWMAFSGSFAIAQNQVQKSLNIKPKQPGVDCDKPDAAAQAKCKVDSAAEKFGFPGFVVFDNTERILRLFLDRNKDGKLDRWSYFKDGIEVYRDSDNDFDGKLDEYRWLGSAGMRKGIDANEDGEIERWETISVEEVAQEAFHAIKNKDNNRFGRLLISNEEFRSLGLTGKVGAELAKRIDTARKGFSSMARGQNQIGKSTTFVYSGTGQPGAAAVNKRNGITKDIVCYDHASVVFKNGETVGNLALGTIVQVNGTWRLMELPEIVNPEKPIQTGGSLFPMELFPPDEPIPNKIDKELAKAYEEFEKINKSLQRLLEEDNLKKNAVRIASLHEQKAMAGIQIYNLAPKEEKYSWLLNIADTVSDAYQKEEYPGGLSFLKAFSDKLKGANRTEGLDYIRWRSIYAKYQLIIQVKDSQARREALTVLMDDLKKFVNQYPNSKFAPEALFQLGFNNEVGNNGDKTEAIKMYSALAQKYGNTNFGKRAKGALTRLQGRGKPISFKGAATDGKKFDSASQKGKIVLIHFWNSNATNGLDEIQKLNAKYDKELVVVGANIDMQTKDFQGYMRQNREINWTQLHAPGGMEESELAVQIGLVSLPMALLIDKEGKLIETTLPFPDLDREIQRLAR